MRRWLRHVVQRYRTELLLAALVIAFAAPFMDAFGAQQGSRYALTAGVWDHGSVTLDRYEEVVLSGPDKAEIDGRTVSDKAPGQPFFAVPAYALHRILGGRAAEDVRDPSGGRGLWMVNVWSVVLPAAVLAALIFRLVRDHAPDRAVAATVTIVFGSMLLPFSTVLFGHVLAACLGVVTFLLARDASSSSRLALAGFVGGLAVVVEYPMLLVVGIIGAWLAWRLRSRVIWYGLGGLPTVALLGAYNLWAFGHPLRISYRFSTFSPGPPSGLFGIGGPDLMVLGRALFGDRGLFILAPVLLLALAGSYYLWKKDTDQRTRAEALVGLTIFVAFLLIPAGWSNAWGGASPGPRYVTPALPFLALPLARFWERHRALTPVAAVSSIAVMLMATVTRPLALREVGSVLPYWWGLLSSGMTSRTLYTELMGSAGWAVHAATVTFIAGVLVHVRRRARLS